MTQMIISEKQILQLLTFARNYIDELNKQGFLSKVLAGQVTCLVSDIMKQQSEELKEVE